MNDNGFDEEEKAAVRRVLSGDKDAFAIIVDRYKDAIFNLAYRMTGNYEDAHDLAQETFLRAYRKLRYYRADHKFFTWLYTIGINLIRNHLKRKRIERLFQFGTERQEEASTHDFPGDSEKELMAGQDRANLGRHLLKLPAGFREAIVLRYFENLSFEEIAGIADISVSSAKMRVYRGLEKLQDLLRE